MRRRGIDIVDRGRDTIALYRLMDSLRAQAERAGGAVVSLLGNHGELAKSGSSSALFASLTTCALIKS